MDAIMLLKTYFWMNMEQQTNIIIPDYITYEYEGVEFNQRKEDGYINLTQMVRIKGNKKINDWKRLNCTRAYINEVSLVTGIPVMDLLYVTGGAINKVTWGHKLVAIHLTKWISPMFHVWCNQTLLTNFDQTYTTKLKYSPSMLKASKINVSKTPSEYIDQLVSIKPLVEDDIDLFIHTLTSILSRLSPTD